MKRLALALCAVVAASCAAPPATPPPLTGEADTAAATELRGKIDEMFRSLDSGAADEMMSWADPEAVVYDFDQNNSPVSKRGTAEIQEFLDSYSKLVREGGMQVTSTVVGADCKSTAVAGFCTVEFDQSLVMNGETMGPFKFRGTLVARKMADGWKWIHWHGSFREMPPPPTPPAAAAPAGATG
jgi:hypothetical protein